MLEKIISVQDMLGIAIIAGVLIKIFQFWKEGKLFGTSTAVDCKGYKKTGSLYQKKTKFKNKGDQS